MTHETLRTHLHNEPLISAIKAKLVIDEKRKSLCAALNIMNDAGISKPACMEVQAKIDEYRKISKYYGNMLDDVFDLTWQAEAIILKHLDKTDTEIEMLPSKLTF